MNNYKTLETKAIHEQFETLIIKVKELAAVSPHLQKSGYTKKLQELAPELAIMPESELVTLQEILNNNPFWLELPGVIDNLIIKITNVTLALQPKTDDNSTLRAICITEPCFPGPSQVQVDDLLIAVAAADIAVAVAQGVVDGIPQSLPGDIPNPAYYIALVVKVALELTAKGLALAAAIQQKAADQRAACEENAFQQAVLDMCSTINEIQAQVDTINRKIDLIDSKINILLRLVIELKNLVEEILRRQIEENLAKCKALVSLYLPEAAGGRLETVQNLIQTLINEALSAGLPIGDAESYLKQGFVTISNKDYCKALQWFSLAYQQLLTNECCQIAKDKLVNCK